jgi:hypothetical protein
MVEGGNVFSYSNMCYISALFVNDRTFRSISEKILTPPPYLFDLLELNTYKNSAMKWRWGCYVKGASSSSSFVSYHASICHVQNASKNVTKCNLLIG